MEEATIELLKQQITSMEKMYLEDTSKLKAQISEVSKERDMWKDRCLSAEAEKIQVQRAMRHV